MHDPAATLATISLLVIWTALSLLAGWALLARLPLAARRPVPWNGWDVLVVLGAYVLFMGALVLIARWGLGMRIDAGKGSVPVGAQAAGSMGADRPGGGKNAESLSAKEKTAMHPLLVALGRRHQPGTLLLCGFMAVLVAPFSEEFFFRLLLQGWLEAAEGHWRRRRRRLLAGLLPVLLVALLFAAGHSRQATPPEDVDLLLAVTVLDGLARLLALAFAVAYLRFHKGATAADLGWVPEKLPRDLTLGLAAIVCSLPLLIFVQAAAGIILKKVGVDVAADPITLFLFAVVVGILYLRTHRIAPSIAMHVAFNAIMLTAAWYLPKM